MPARQITLKPGGGHATPERVLFVDVEPQVSPVPGRPAARSHTFGICYAESCHLSNGEVVARRARQCVTLRGFWGFLDQEMDRHKSTWVFAHNLGYDLTLLGLWDQLSSGYAELVDCVLEDPPTVVTVRRRRRLIRFVDVMNYWRLSLSDLASSINWVGVSKPAPPESPVPDMEVAKWHVGIIAKVVLTLIAHLSETKLCSLRTTAAGLSWGAFCTSFLGRPISLHSRAIVRRLERAAYFGGRAEVRSTGIIPGPVSVLDCHSLYPSVMHDDDLPCELVSHTRGLRSADLRAALRYYDGVADITVVGRDYPYPRRCGGVPAFVAGPGRVCLAGDELRLAGDRAAIRAVHEVALYRRDNLFKGFVGHFWRQRRAAAAAGDRAGEMISKLMLNSLYGKFAQKGRSWTDAEDVPARGRYCYWWHRRSGAAAPVRVRALAGAVQAREAGPDPRHCAPAISAAVCAAGRVRLEGDLSLAGRHNVHYCDTDSVHCSLPGFHRLAKVGRIAPGVLGHLREIVRGQDAEYWGRGHYRVGDRHVVSGLKTTAVEVADGLYLQDAMRGVERTLESGALTEVIVEDRLIHLSERSEHARAAAQSVG